MIAALPQPSDAPNPGAAAVSVASTVSQKLVGGFEAVLPYVVALVVLFTVASLVFRLFLRSARGWEDSVFTSSEGASWEYEERDSY